MDKPIDPVARFNELCDGYKTVRNDALLQLVAELREECAHLHDEAADRQAAAGDSFLASYERAWATAFRSLTTNAAQQDSQGARRSSGAEEMPAAAAPVESLCKRCGRELPVIGCSLTGCEYDQHKPAPSQTPRTDAKVEENRKRGVPCSEAVPAYFARELERECNRLREDAERYRFFRNPPKPTATGDMEWAELGSLHGEELDAAIDAALKKEPG